MKTHPSFVRHIATSATLLLVAMIPAQAANVTFNETIDLDAWAANSYDLTGTNQVTISNGDVVTLNYTFANNKALQMTNSTGGTLNYVAAWPWLQAVTNYGSFQISTSTSSLVNANFLSGSGTTTISTGVQSSGSAHLGPYAGFDLDSLSTVMFTGLTSTFTVDYLPGGTNDYRFWFHGFANGTQIAIVNAQVPELSNPLALLGAALGSLALARRKLSR